MFKINIYAVGEIKEKAFKEIINEYTKRISRFATLKIIETKEEKIQGLTEQQVKVSEAKNILSRLNNDSYVILLDIFGKSLDSANFSLEIKGFIDKGISPINFIIGGTLGVDESIVNRANLRISLSDMTFPHQLARIILLEQIYRSFKIINNEPYHH